MVSAPMRVALALEAFQAAVSLDPTYRDVGVGLADKCHHIVNAKECQEIVNAPHAWRGST